MKAVIDTSSLVSLVRYFLPFDKEGKLMVPFRTWRNTITGEAAEKLTKELNFNIPQRWSIAHLYQAILNNEEHIGKIPESKEEFIQVTMGRISFTMRDPVIRKTRMFLVQEQFRNERISEVTTMHQLDGIQLMFAKIIKGMMEKGLVKEDDPALLSAELTAPAVLQIARADRQPQYLEESLENIEKHIRHFCKVYMKDSE